MYNSAASGYGSTPTYSRGLPVASYGSQGPMYGQSLVVGYNISGAPAVSVNRGYASFDERAYVPSQEVRHQNVHEGFLVRSRPKTQFVGDASMVKEFVEEAFEKVVGEQFPKNIRVVVGSADEIRRFHSGTWSDGILGFSINRQGAGMNEIYVRANDLDVLMLTIGHEIGHVMSKTLADIHDEEAKAFAFELAWVNTIIENNIAGLEECFHPAPANNGLHDVAFGFVRQCIDRGRQAIDVFADLVWGKVSMQDTLEWRVNW